MMNEWTEIIEGDESTLPIENVLVLVLQEGFTHLRSRAGDDWYDEDEIYDDSEMRITHWHPLPEEPIWE